MKSASMLLSLVASASLLACGGTSDSSRPAGGGSTNVSTGAGGSVGSGGSAASGNGGSSSTAAGGSAGSSGGSAGGSAGTINTNTGNGMDLDCGRKSFDVHPKPAEILLVLDRSGSMKDVFDTVTKATRWDTVVPAVNQVVTDTSASVFWGLKTFPEGSVMCGVTNKIDVPIAPMNGSNVTGAITSTTPEGDGTPTPQAVNAAVAYLKTLTDNNPKYLLLATDGEPSCDAIDATTIRTQATQAVAAAATAGFHTFVVGVATSTSSTANTVLTQLAQAGLEARNDPNPLATRYYSANTKQEITDSLKQITGVVASCSFDLGGPPPVPDNIAVKVGGVKAPQDPADGWGYTSPDNSTLTVNGSWCDKVKASPDPVQIIFACKGDVIN